MIAEHPPFSPTDMATAFDAQRRSYRAQPNPPLAARKAKLAALERAIGGHRRALHAALLADFRKPPVETELTEIVGTLAELKFTRDHLAAWMRPRSVATPLTLLGSASQIRSEPKGVALILAPWNYPFYLTMVPLIAAVAAGNRVIVRPSEKTPATREVMAQIVREAFAPHDVALFGGDVDVANELLRLPFDHIFFTGSTHVGKSVMHAAAEHLASVTLELGGKSPCIVAADADIGRAAARIAWGKFLNAGQTCVAPDYVLVHESAERPFIDAIVEKIAKMYGPEAAREDNADLCRLIDDRAFERVSGLLAQSLANGAIVETGAATDATQRYIAPTVLSGVTFDSPIMREEIFGPVLPVLRYRSLDAALAQIRNRPKPLALYVFTSRDETAHHVIDATSAGGTLINDTVLHVGNPHLPFGGTGESGSGSYHGIFGFKAFSHERAVMRQAKTSPVGLLTPPYTASVRAIVHLIGRLT